MHDPMGLVVKAAKSQGFSVSSNEDESVWVFRKGRNTFSVRTPKRPVDFMELRARLVEMGMIWPF